MDLRFDWFPSYGAASKTLCDACVLSPAKRTNQEYGMHTRVSISARMFSQVCHLIASVPFHLDTCVYIYILFYIYTYMNTYIYTHISCMEHVEIYVWETGGDQSEDGPHPDVKNAQHACG